MEKYREQENEGAGVGGGHGGTERAVEGGGGG